MSKARKPAVGELPYFAFGSNLDPYQMARRIPGAVFQQPAFLSDYAFQFQLRPGAPRPGVANVVARKGAEVAGMLVRLPPGGILDLDLYEGVPTTYQRVYRCVKAKRGGRWVPVWAHVYVMAGEGGPRVPEPAYFDRVASGYDIWGLDPQPLHAALRAAARTTSAPRGWPPPAGWR